MQQGPVKGKPFGSYNQKTTDPNVPVEESIGQEKAVDSTAFENKFCQEWSEWQADEYKFIKEVDEFDAEIEKMEAPLQVRIYKKLIERVTADKNEGKITSIQAEQTVSGLNKLFSLWFDR
jgi:hypothetical protein